MIPQEKIIAKIAQLHHVVEELLTVVSDAVEQRTPVHEVEEKAFQTLPCSEEGNPDSHREVCRLGVVTADRASGPRQYLAIHAVCVARGPSDREHCMHAPQAGLRQAIGHFLVQQKPQEPFR